MDKLPAGWNPVRFNMTVEWLSGPISLAVNGYSNGLIALDKRENRTFSPRVKGEGWCLTHLPTGYAIRHLICSKRAAFEIADALLAAVDWNFSDPAEAKLRGPAVRRLLDHFGEKKFVAPSDLGPPVKAEPTASGQPA